MPHSGRIGRCSACAYDIFEMAVVLAALMATVFSLGYDMAQPLLAGIVTTLGRKRIGLAMGLNVFALFT